MSVGHTKKQENAAPCLGLKLLLKWYVGTSVKLWFKNCILLLCADINIFTYNYGNSTWLLCNNLEHSMKKKES